MTYQLIETKTLGTATSSIAFDNIPQDGTDLYILASLRVTGGNDTTIRFNDSTTGYTNRYLFGNGSAASSGTAYGNYVGTPAQNADTANTFSNQAIYIPNYTGSTNKSVSVDSVNENNATAAAQAIVALLWSNTAAITKVQIQEASFSNLAVGSTISLYKITRGSSNGVVVS